MSKMLWPVTLSNGQNEAVNRFKAELIKILFEQPTAEIKLDFKQFDLSSEQKHILFNHMESILKEFTRWNRLQIQVTINQLIPLLPPITLDELNKVLSIGDKAEMYNHEYLSTLSQSVSLFDIISALCDRSVGETFEFIIDEETGVITGIMFVEAIKHESFFKTFVKEHKVHQPDNKDNLTKDIGTMTWFINNY